MEFTTIDGKKVDTHKLPDKEAEINEALVNLYEICKRYDCPMFARIILNNKKFLGAKLIGDSVKTEFMFELINEFVVDASNNQIVLIKVNKNVDTE